jgi:hypothetical protein
MPRRLLLLLPLAGCGGDPPADPSTTSTSSPSTTSATVDPPGTSTGETTASPTTGGPTQEPCLCEPGAHLGCASTLIATVCGDDCRSESDVACPEGQVCGAAGCGPGVCTPGEVVCADGGGGTQTCARDGAGFAAPVPCDEGESCEAGVCTSACAKAAANPSSVGCSFFAHTMDNYYPVEEDSVIVGNVGDAPATVRLFTQQGGAEIEVGAAAVVDPGAVLELKLTNPEIESASAVRADGAYHVVSDVPVVAYQHAPIGAQQTNDASMLLPEHAFGRVYVIASAPEGQTYPGHLSYFTVIAAEDDTTVAWTPPVATLAGDGVAAVAAGATGEVKLGRLATLQVAAAATVDLSGTVVVSDRPVWVVGASACTSIPSTLNTCDHIEEQMLPVEYWGRTYAAINAPRRGEEEFRWRIFGGADGVEVTTTPDYTSGPFTLDRGEFWELVAPTSFVITSTGPVLPVQYLESQNGGAGTGDPSTVQMVPVEQFLRGYVFATGTGYDNNWVQVVRAAGGAEVQIDGVAVADWTPLGDYEVAEVEVDEGAHAAGSAAPFGIVNVGYTQVTSYAYPGGMQLTVLNPPG